MKNIRKFCAVLLLMTISAIGANAQQKGILKFDLQYNYGLPLGSFKNDIISNSSPRGVTGALMYSINKKWAFGLQSGYQDYYQKYPRAIYKTGDNESTSAVLSNSISVVPVLAKALYTPLGSNKSFIKPYVSAGAGISVVDFRQYLGEFSSASENGSFTLQGGAGIMVPFGKGSASGFSLGADYNYISYKNFGYNNLDNVSLHAGVHFPLR